MSCYCSNITETAQSFIDAEKDPQIIRVDLEISGSQYSLVLNRDVPFTLSGFFAYNEQTDTYTLEPEPWSSVILTFENDLDVSTSPIASVSFPVSDPGVTDPAYTPGSGTLPNIDSSERWQGVIPATELNKLAGYDWVTATLKGDDNTLISKCAFRVLGG